MPGEIPTTDLEPDDLIVEVRRGDQIIHTASTGKTAKTNAGVNPAPDLLRMLADHIERWDP